MPASVWTGNLRLSLVIIPVRLYPASSDQGVAFRMIHEKSGEPIQYRKGIETEHGFEEVPDEEIVKGYEYAKGHYVLLKPDDLDNSSSRRSTRSNWCGLSSSRTWTLGISKNPTTSRLMAMKPWRASWS